MPTYTYTNTNTHLSFCPSFRSTVHIVHGLWICLVAEEEFYLTERRRERARERERARVREKRALVAQGTLMCWYCVANERELE